MATTVQSVKGIVALVTGGASGVVERLIRQGAAGVIAIDRFFESKYTESNVLSLTADVTSEADIQSVLTHVKKQFGRLDALVNCAGIGNACKVYDFKRKVAHPLDEFKCILEVNAVGTFNVTRLAVGLIGENEPVNSLRGVVINTASVAAFDGQVGQAAYAASKSAVVGMTLPIARDLFDTPLLSALPEEARQRLAAEVPCPSRLGTVDEYAHLVQTIIENQMINGEVIRIDGALRLMPLRGWNSVRA